MKTHTFGLTDAMKTQLSSQQSAPQVSEREAGRLIATEVAQVLGHRAEENLHWQGTVVDLMEALHLAYTAFELTDDDGLYISFTALVARVCAILHVARPSNPYEVAARGSRRKSLYSPPYLQRYRRRLASQPHPLQSQILSE